MTAVRRPWIAGLLSFLLPGLGHLYVGRPGLAIGAGLVGFPLGALLYLGAWFAPLPPLNVVLPLLLLAMVWVGVPVHAALVAKRIGPDYTLRGYNRWYIYAGLYLVLGILVFPTILRRFRTDMVEPFRNPSGSMEPTLQTGDFLYATKWPMDQRRPTHGRLVVFESVEEPGLKVIKRVIGMPGDTMFMRSGSLERNGRPLQEPYAIHTDPARSEDAIQRAKMRQWQSRHLLGTDTGYAPDLQDWGPLVVPVDSFFALGDNRDASYDSRYYGFVPFVNVAGRASVIYFSFLPKSDGPFFSRVLWSRIGKRLN